MILFAIPITINPSLKALGVSGRASAEIWREAHYAAGRYWWDHYLQDHFREGADAKYGYQPRTLGYLKAKRNAARKGKAVSGGRVSLVFRGLTRDAVKSWAYIQAYPSRCSVRMHGPRYVSMNPKVGKNSRMLPNMGREIVTVTDDQRVKMAEVMLDSFRASFRRLNLPETITVSM